VVSEPARDESAASYDGIGTTTLRRHAFATLRPRGGHTRCTAAWRMHDQPSLCRAPTLIDVMDHVLDKGVIVETPTSASTETASTSHIALLDVTVRVNVTTDAEDALKETAC